MLLLLRSLLESNHPDVVMVGQILAILQSTDQEIEERTDGLAVGQNDQTDGLSEGATDMPTDGPTEGPKHHLFPDRANRTPQR